MYVYIYAYVFIPIYISLEIKQGRRLLNWIETHCHGPRQFVGFNLLTNSVGLLGTVTGQDSYILTGTGNRPQYYSWCCKSSCPAVTLDLHHFACS